MNPFLRPCGGWPTRTSAVPNLAFTPAGRDCPAYCQSLPICFKNVLFTTSPYTKFSATFRSGQLSWTQVPAVVLTARGLISRPSMRRKNGFPPRAAALLLAVGTLLLTGCQTAPVLNRTVYVTPAAPPAADEGSGHSAGMDVPFGSVTFGITCGADSVGNSTRGTAALMCTWRTEHR
jgi:hypothetical protein